MSKIKNYVKATAYKVAMLLDLVDDNQRMKDGKTVTLLKDGTPVNEANTLINIALHKNDDGTSIFVDGFLNGTTISTAHLYTNMTILENAIEIINHQVSPILGGLQITYDDISNAAETTLDGWNDYFDFSFTTLNISGNTQYLNGTPTLLIKSDLFQYDTNLISLIDENTIIELDNSSTGCFYECDNLSTVILPICTSIGNNAFNYCYRLINLNIQSAITIGEYAFSDCSALSGVSLPFALTLNDASFNSCTSLSSIDAPLATSVGTKTFFQDRLLTHINLSSCISMGTDVFSGISGNTIDLWIPIELTGNTNIISLRADNNVILNP